MPPILVELVVLSHISPLQGRFYWSWVLEQVLAFNLYEDLLPRYVE